MPPESSPELKGEIGHVLFLDIVGYSRLLIDQQSERLQQLKQIVRDTPQVQAATAEGALLRLPTGDGMALVFRDKIEQAIECALEISASLRSHPELPLRMGIHSGPINPLLDVNEHANVAGAGIDLAQRVMDCGDAGHILLSRRAADDLAPYPRWNPHLHDLGEIEVKHGARLHLVNFFTAAAGNPARPAKLPGKNRLLFARRELLVVGALLLISLGGAVWWLTQRSDTPVTKTPDSPGAQHISEKSIAVLPFENLSAEKDNAFFADGIQDEILTNLAKVADLKVISRTSVMPYRNMTRNLREIGQQLGVAYLLEGSVQRVGGKVRVNAQLIDARTDAHLWAQIYDRQLADVFVIQSEISKAIADQLHAKLSPDEKSSLEQKPTTDLAAYELYLRAQSLYADASNQLRAAEKLPEAARLLDQAVTRDPEFLLAWCRLSRVHSLIYWQGHDHTPRRLELADKAVQNALRIDPKAGEAHLALAD